MSRRCGADAVSGPIDISAAGVRAQRLHMLDGVDLRQLSKAASYHLRHGSDVALLPGGWARVDDLLDVVGARSSRGALRDVTTTSAKPRFEMSADDHLIRARYGHSREVDLELVPTQPPAVLYHGTAAATVPAVLDQGIQRRGRRYVHLSESIATAVEVGARHGRPAVLCVAAGQMAADGHHLFHAATGMWLTAAVPPQYLEEPQ